MANLAERLELEIIGNQLNTIYERDKGICWICGNKVKRKDASKDHLIPKAHGGSDYLDNLKLAHKKCNSDRGDSCIGCPECTDGDLNATAC